ncbi:hypothetical protein PAXRUDRAFT_821480 [Paxillus rubicundulus Ve08.2h10]|uniref:Uncharacterized protein n=1 Tax=Paxillus rubicundulus Ve08.2h10 TaxID=930991 RepID=A0A0D0DY79_9AGAM|nr:hypothetical protein PAXRUDRAFT_821480 [Paxillus rubicundulus Ve08.2h10]
MPKQVSANLEDNFVKDAKICKHRDGTSSMNEKHANTQADDLLFYCIDLKTSFPEHLPHSSLGLTPCFGRSPASFRYDELF